VEREEIITISPSAKLELLFRIHVIFIGYWQLTALSFRRQLPEPKSTMLFSAPLSVLARTSPDVHRSGLVPPCEASAEVIQ